MRCFVLICSIFFIQNVCAQVNGSIEKLKGPDSYKKEVVQLFRSYSYPDDTTKIDKLFIQKRLNKAKEIVVKFLKVEEVTAIGILISAKEPTRYIFSYYRTSKTSKGDVLNISGEIEWE